MIGAKNELVDKKLEAQILLDLIAELSTQPSAVTKIAMLKSAVVLLFYNMIESMTTIVLTRVHEVVRTESYANLRDELRVLWVDYFINKHPEKNRFQNLEETIGGHISFPVLDDYLKRINLFSGNLDARALDDILKQYGMNALASPGREKLLEIKNKRNKIAHGEEMFKEACRSKTTSEILELRDACFNALDNMVSQADVYISSKEYRRF